MVEGEYKNYHSIECTKNSLIHVDLEYTLAYNSSIRVMNDDSCTPINLELSGIVSV